MKRDGLDFEPTSPDPIAEIAVEVALG